MAQDPGLIGCDPSSQYIAFVTASSLTGTVIMKKYPLRIKSISRYEPYVAAMADDACYDFMQFYKASGLKLGDAYVESPAAAQRNIRGTIVQAFVNGVIQACLIQHGFQVHLPMPTEWKKVVCGSGNADKANVERVVRSRWPKAWTAAGGDGDCLDAAAIYLYGEDLRSRSGSVLGGVRSMQGPDPLVLPAAHTRTRVQRKVRRGSEGTGS